MNRGILMLLLGLNLIVMGASTYILWSRFQRASNPETPATPMPPAVAQKASEPKQTTPKPAKPPKKKAPRKAARSSSKEKRNILFSYRDSVPKRVSIAGDFNNWSPQLMKKDKKHNWTISIKISPGRYAYNFLVDGRMIRDPSNRSSTDAGQKIRSSLLVVKPK